MSLLRQDLLTVSWPSPSVSPPITTVGVPGDKRGGRRGDGGRKLRRGGDRERKRRRRPPWFNGRYES